MGERVRDADHPVEELAHGESRPGLRPHCVCEGLGERRVIFVHALRNSLIPIVTGLGNAISLVLAGSFLIERVFNIDGMGYLGYTSILQRDYPVALGILVIDSVLMLVGNILSDMIYAFVDPRVRFQ